MTTTGEPMAQPVARTEDTVTPQKPGRNGPARVDSLQGGACRAGKTAHAQGPGARGGRGTPEGPSGGDSAVPGTLPRTRDANAPGGAATVSGCIGPCPRPVDVPTGRGRAGVLRAVIDFYKGRKGTRKRGSSWAISRSAKAGAKKGRNHGGCLPFQQDPAGLTVGAALVQQRPRAEAPDLHERSTRDRDGRPARGPGRRGQVARPELMQDSHAADAGGPSWRVADPSRAVAASGRAATPFTVPLLLLTFGRGRCAAGDVVAAGQEGEWALTPLAPHWAARSVYTGLLRRVTENPTS